MSERHACPHPPPQGGGAAPCPKCLAEAVAERDELRTKVDRLEHVLREAAGQNARLEGRVKELSALTVSQGKNFQDAQWRTFDAARRAERAEAGLTAMAAMRDAIVLAHNTLAGGGHMTGLALADVIGSIDAALSSEAASHQARRLAALEAVARESEDYMRARGLETARGARDRLRKALESFAKTREPAEAKT